MAGWTNKGKMSILDAYFRDTTKARRLLPDGSYERIVPARKEKRVSSQEWLYRQARLAVRRAQESRPTAFEPHRAPGAEGGRSR